MRAFNGMTNISNTLLKATNFYRFHKKTTLLHGITLLHYVETENATACNVQHSLMTITTLDKLSTMQQLCAEGVHNFKENM